VRIHLLQAVHVVLGRAIQRCVEILPDIDAQHAPETRAAHVFHQPVDAVVVEAHAIDDGARLLDAEEARPGIAGLRSRRDRSDLYETETERCKRIDVARILVEAGREPDPAHGIKGKQRSVHNNYLTLPVVLAMLGPHFPFAFAGDRGWLVLVLLIIPFWINYLMRMLAWINLLSPDGWGTRVLHNIGIEQLFLWTGLLSARGGWLDGQPSAVIIAFVYGYVPFLILPLFVALDRIDQRHIEAARDLGASRASAFLRVTLPLSVPGILAGCVLVALPMFGDYYTPDLVSASTKTNLIGNQIDQFTRQGSEKVVGAVLTMLLAIVLLALMFYYLRATRRAGEEAAA